MNYKLVYTDRAKRDLSDATNSVAEHAPETSRRWFAGFVKALTSLTYSAEAYSLAPETRHVSFQIRQFIYRAKSRRANRVLYMIRGSNVYILAIRRPGEDLLTEDELKQAVDESE